LMVTTGLDPQVQAESPNHRCCRMGCRAMGERSGAVLRMAAPADDQEKS
jgi:hypothetical protein